MIKTTLAVQPVPDDILVPLFPPITPLIYLSLFYPSSDKSI